MRRGRFLCFQLSAFCTISSSICFYSCYLGSLPSLSRWLWGTEVFVPQTCHKLGLALKPPTLSGTGLETQRSSSSSPQTQAGQGPQGQWSSEGCPIPRCQRLGETPLRCDDPSLQLRSAQCQSLEPKVKLGDVRGVGSNTS